MNIDPRIFAVEKLSDCVTGEAGAVTDGGAHTGSRIPVCPPGEPVKKSKSPADSSSFPRKRESRGGARKIFRRLYCRDARLDSRFRGNDEVLSVDCRLSLRRLAGVPGVIRGRHPFSSHARKRESGGGRAKDSPMFYCGSAAWVPAFEHVKKSERPTNTSSFPRKRESSLPPLQENCRGVFQAGGLDSRFRGNDEVLLADYCLLPRRIFDASVFICENLSISSHDREREA